MRKKLLKHLILALLLTAAVPYAKSQVAHVGDILCTTGVYVSPAEFDDSGLEAMGVIFYVDATGQHGWAVALENAGSYSIGQASASSLPIFTSVRTAIYDLNGQFNTQEILNYYTNYGYSYPQWFQTLHVADGWYLPAIGQLNYLYGNLMEVNNGLDSVDGVEFNMSSSWEYMSSTRGYVSGCTWTLKSSGAIEYVSSSSGANTRTFRGVRNF